MNVEEKGDLFSRIAKIEVILSIIAAIIEIGLIASYVGSAITFDFAVIAGLCVAVVFLAIDFIRKRRTLKRHDKEQSLSEDLPSVATYVKAMEPLPKEFKIDTQILYDKITHTYEINGSNGNYNRHTKGTNVSDEEFRRMVYRICGETSVGNESVKPNVSRRLPGNELEKLTPAILWSASNIKVLGVDLNPVVRPKTGKIDVTFSAKWPGAFTSKNGYLFASLSHCTVGCKRLVMRALFKEKITQVSVWTWDLKKHELKEFEILKNPKCRNGKYTIKWQRTNPDIHKIYILRYIRNGKNLV